MSVKQEHRYYRLVLETGRAVTDRQREIEAATMERKPRPPVIPPKPNASRRQVRSWMRNNADGYDCATQLAEAANAALDLPPDAMNDETHWVWDEAVDALEWHELSAESPLCP